MRRTLAVLSTALLAGAVLASPPAAATRPGDAARFETWVGYDVGRFPTAVAAGDFNGDGLADAAWARDDFFDSTLSVTLNLGDGTLGAAVTYPTTEQSTDVVAADLDGDGDVDLAVTAIGNGYDNETVDLFLNDGGGTFTPASTPGGFAPEQVTAGDVDGDADVDLVLANYNEYPDGTVTVLRNAGDATFTAESTAAGWRVHDVVIGDLTGDGRTDLGAARLNEDVNRYELHVLEPRPNGRFAPDPEPQQFDLATNGGVGSPDLAAGDLDGDDDLDLVVGGGATFEDAVLTNDGTGAFAVTTYDAPSLAVELVDLDGDADLDITGVAGGGGTRGSLTVQRNQGDGTFAAQEVSVTGNNPMGLAVADLQGDGRPDVLVPARDIGAGITHRQLAGGGFAAPGNGQFFAPSVGVATGDVDGDGDVDVAAAVGGFSGDQTIRVLDNDGAGELTEVASLPSDDDPRSLSIADLDEDGDADLAWLAGYYGTQVVTTALNDGTGGYAAPTTHRVTTCGDHLSLGDVDGDGDLDEVVGNEENCAAYEDVDKVSVSLNDGTGTFGEERLVPMTLFTGDTAVADVDRDGVADLVGASALAADDDVAVALGQGDGTFAPPVLTTSGAAHREIVVTDLDADGDLDFASNAFEDGTAVLLGEGSGAFGRPRFLAGETVHGYRNQVGIAAGDVNGDTIPDLVVANETGSDVGVHAGLGDGQFEPRQVRYGMQPRVTDVALADLDGDRVLDIISPAQLPDGLAARSAKAVAAPEAPGLGLLFGTRPRCTIRGTADDDVLVGTPRSDVICGFAGDDRILGLGGGDVLLGAAGDDDLRGGSGLDVVRGGPGDDRLSGAGHADRLRGDRGTDVLSGGGGPDTLDLVDPRSTAGGETADAGSGSDHCRRDAGDTVTSCP